MVQQISQRFSHALHKLQEIASNVDDTKIVKSARKLFQLK